MRGGRLVLAALAGIAFTAVLALSINIPVAFIDMLALFLLAPGGVLGSLLVKSHSLDPFGLGSPVATLVFSSVIYSAIVYLMLHGSKITLSGRRFSAATVVTLLLAGLACVPSISPLWPRGVSELTEKERRLRDGLPLGSDLTSAQAFLRRQMVDFNKYEAKSEEVILQRADLEIHRWARRLRAFNDSADRFGAISLRLPHRHRPCIRPQRKTEAEPYRTFSAVSVRR